MLCFAASAADNGGVHEVIVGDVGLIAAVAAAVPEDVAFCVTVVGGVEGCEPAEALALNINGCADGDHRLL